MSTEQNNEQIIEKNTETTQNQEAAQNPKKGLLAIGIIAAAILIIIAIQWLMPRHSPIGTSGLYEKEEVNEQVISVIELFNVDDYSFIQAITASDSKKSLNADSLKKMKTKISDDWGGFRGFGKVTLSEKSSHGKIYATGEVKAQYENVAVTYTVTLDEDLLLADFSVK